MDIQELQVTSWTIGRLTKLQYVKRNCGTYAAAKMLKNRGYTIEQALNLLNRG